MLYISLMELWNALADHNGAPSVWYTHTADGSVGTHATEAAHGLLCKHTHSGSYYTRLYYSAFIILPLLEHRAFSLYVSDTQWCSKSATSTQRAVCKQATFNKTDWLEPRTCIGYAL